MKAQIDLLLLFQRINEAHFDGFLTPPRLLWNTRLRSSAGRFFPGSRKFWREVEPKIEIASYLLGEENSLALIEDTLAHEMIHYWLWVRRRPYGHTTEFHSKMRLMGVSRYNSVPKLRAFRYVYRCLNCTREFFAKRRLGPLACATCCKKENGGRFDARFKLVLDRQLERAEGLELAKKSFRPVP